MSIIFITILVSWLSEQAYHTFEPKDVVEVKTERIMIKMTPAEICSRPEPTKKIVISRPKATRDRSVSKFR